MKKYEFTGETKLFFDHKLYRIRALIAFGSVEVGEVGGWIEKEENLDQSGNAWVYGDAEVYGNAWVYGDAWVSGNARVSGNAWVSGNALVSGDARVYGNADVSGNAWVSGDARVSGNARVYGDAEVYGNAWVSGDARVYGDARVHGDAWVLKCTHILQIGAIGSRDGFTTFFRTKEKKIKVVCGCFYGTVPEFLAKVESTHGNSKHGKVYSLAAELAVAQIEDVE